MAFLFFFGVDLLNHWGVYKSRPTLTTLIRLISTARTSSTPSCSTIACRRLFVVVTLHHKKSKHVHYTFFFSNIKHTLHETIISYKQKVLTFQMASFTARFNRIALVERFNHTARMQACSYEGIEVNTRFRMIYVSNVDEDGRGARVVLSLMMRGNSIGQLYLPPRFNNLFTTTDLCNINEDRVRFSVTVVKLGNGPRHLRFDFLIMIHK